MNLNNRPAPTCIAGEAIVSIDENGDATCGQAGFETTQTEAILTADYTPPTLAGNPQPPKDIPELSVSLTEPGTYLLYYHVWNLGNGASFEIRDGDNVRVPGTALYINSSYGNSAMAHVTITGPKTYKVVMKSRVGQTSTVKAASISINVDLPNMESVLRAVRLS